jgi:hypothetical protein
LFCDGIGDRVVAADGATGELLQILRIRPALTAVPSFEFALRERAARLANFRHAYYARVRRVDRVQLPGPGLAIVSDHVEGTRLSDILRVAQETRIQLDINAALCLIRQLVPAVALLHENARDVAHGLIAPERLIVTPHARLVIVEHVIAGAIEQLQFPRERLWQEFRIAMPPTAGLSRFDHRADVTGVGLVALALLLGRPLGADEFPHRLSHLLNESRERTALGEEQPLSPSLRDWLSRAMQLDARRAFASAPEALTALEELVADDSMYVAAPVALETFLSRYIAAVLEPPVAGTPPSADHAFVAQGYSQPEAQVPSAQPAPRHVPAEAAAHLAVFADETGHSSHVMTPKVDPPPAPRVVEFTEEKIAPVIHAPAYTPVTAPPQAPVHAPVYTQAPAPAPPVAPPAPIVPPAPVQAAPPVQAPAPVPPPPVVQPPMVVAAPAPPPAPRQAPVSAPPQNAPSLADLIPVADLTPPAEKRPLFDPDNPFTVPPTPQHAPAKKRLRIRVPKKLVMSAAALVVVAAMGFVAPKFLGTTAAPPPQMGTLVVESNPAGVQVFVDGVDRGPTPATVSVKAGAHILELRGRGVPRSIPFTVAAGGQVSHHIEFANTPELGQLRVESQPAGAKVLVDGVDKGAAPLTVADLTPGDHEVILQSDETSVRHVVNVQAGGTASLVAPVAAAPAAGTGPVSGWLSVKAPFSIEIREEGRVIGTTDAERIMMAAGRHEIQLVNETLGYRVSRVVTVQPGKVASLTADLPNGTVNLNAAPWAEVFIDGQRVGETPIGNLSVPIGPHEVVFRHPQFGEKRHAISVTLGAPVRLSVDMK